MQSSARNGGACSDFARHSREPMTKMPASDPPSLPAAPRSWVDTAVRIVAWTASLGGLGTIFATLIGYYFHRGMVEGLGLPAGLFPISIQDALLISHEASLVGLAVNGLPWLTNWFEFGWASLFVGVCFVIGGTIGVISLRRHRRPPSGKQLNPLQLAGALALYGLFGGAVTYWLPRVLLVASVTVLALPRFSYDLARQEGQKMLARTPCDGQSPCARIDGEGLSGGTAVVGRVVLSNEHWIAVRTAETLLVLPAEHLRLSFDLKVKP